MRAMDQFKTLGLFAATAGVCIGVAILWLRVVDGVQSSVTDLVGVAVSLLGMAIIMWGPRVRAMGTGACSVGP